LEKQQGVISIGEAFVDFIAKDQSNTDFHRLLGGATVNVATVTSRLGIPAYYLCKLGTDETSLYVEHELKKETVNVEYSVRTPNKKICGVYIHLTEGGERYFHAYVNETPDEVLTEEELQKEPFVKSKIFYFGSGTLFHDTARKATEKAIKLAKETGTLIAFDPNIRLKRWDSEATCRHTVCPFLKQADIVKMSEEELLFLTEAETVDEGLQRISAWNIPHLFITMGSKGACTVLGSTKISVQAKKVNAVDTTGAGDAFMAALLYCVHESGIPTNRLQAEALLHFANEIGAIATTKVGSLTALSDPQTITSKSSCS
jgi:fructokinase